MRQLPKVLKPGTDRRITAKALAQLVGRMPEAVSRSDGH